MPMASEAMPAPRSQPTSFHPRHPSTPAAVRATLARRPQPALFLLHHLSAQAAATRVEIAMVRDPSPPTSSLRHPPLVYPMAPAPTRSLPLQRRRSALPASSPRRPSSPAREVVPAEPAAVRASPVARNWPTTSFRPRRHLAEAPARRVPASGAAARVSAHRLTSARPSPHPAAAAAVRMPASWSPATRARKLRCRAPEAQAPLPCRPPAAKSPVWAALAEAPVLDVALVPAAA